MDVNYFDVYILNDVNNFFNADLLIPSEISLSLLSFMDKTNLWAVIIIEFIHLNLFDEAKFINELITEVSAELMGRLIQSTFLFD